MTKSKALVWISIFVMATGVSALLGWALHLEPLKAPLPHHVSMKANTAVGLIAAGLSLFLRSEGGRWPTLARALAGFAGLLGAATLLEVAGGWDLGIDQALFREAPGAVGTGSPGRMAPLSALSFLLVAPILAYPDAVG